MKYLKGIFESSDSKEDIKDFVEGCFAYLLDDGFGIQVRVDFSDRNLIFLYKNDHSGFTWDEVKDYYIPFIKILSNKYKLEVLANTYKDYDCIVGFTYYIGMDSFSYEQIIEDDLFIKTKYQGKTLLHSRGGFADWEKINRIVVKISV